MMPSFIGQFNLDFKPHQNWYIRLENVLMSGWYNRFFFPPEILPDFNNQTKGYYTLDALVRYDLNQQLSIYGRVVNVFNADYGGIGATGFDIDLPYNPQYLRTFQFGLNFSL